MHFPCHVLFCTNHKSIDPTSSQMRRYKNTRHVLYILSQLFSSRLFHVVADWLDPVYVVVVCVAMDAAASGINSAEERHVSTS